MLAPLCDPIGRGDRDSQTYICDLAAQSDEVKLEAQEFFESIMEVGIPVGQFGDQIPVPFTFSTIRKDGSIRTREDNFKLVEVRGQYYS